MKGLLIVGVLLVLLGGGLMVMGSVKVEDKHEANILGAELSVTETDRKAIPVVVSGSILGLGLILAGAGAVKSLSKR